jgi:uncharacterized protein YhbP (UPF0306 family)
VVERSSRRFSARRLSAVAARLLDAAPLCAVATVDVRGAAHVNTAYFAWTPRLDVYWLSAPEATHSRNIAERRTAAVAVYDSHQSWGRPDRGIQLFGSARLLGHAAAAEARQAYAARFAGYDGTEFAAYRFYRLRPRRVKLFDERELGSGVFVTARVRAGALEWERTEIYRSDV